MGKVEFDAASASGVVDATTSETSRMSATRRNAATVLRSTGAVALAIGVLAGCSGVSGMNTKEAKQSIVTFVEGSTDVVGDDWEVQDGPGLGKCGLGPGVGGVQYVYAMVRSASADPKADVVAVERHWKDLGVTTERYQTGGDDPILGSGAAAGR